MDTIKHRKTTYCKLAKPNGWDFYTGNTINYRAAAQSSGKAKIVKCPLPDKEEGLCSSGVLHASKNPNDCFVGAKIPCSAYKVKGKPIIRDEKKCGFFELEIVEEIMDLDSLFGWKYSEAINPINPLKIAKHIPTDSDFETLKAWASVRASVGASVWDSVRPSVGASVWDSFWDSVWGSVWDSIRNMVWPSVWDSVWPSVWGSIRASVWGSIWAYIGSLFPKTKKWRYIKHKIGEYPYQPSVDLWKRGFVPSFDGKIWRLHSGINAEVLWEGTLR